VGETKRLEAELEKKRGELAGKEAEAEQTRGGWTPAPKANP